LHLCHIHANNFGGLDPRGDPLALEMTFTRYPPRDRDVVTLPHPLDMPNDPRLPEVGLQFA